MGFFLVFLVEAGKIEIQKNNNSGSQNFFTTLHFFLNVDTFKSVDFKPHCTLFETLENVKYIRVRLHHCSPTHDGYVPSGHPRPPLCEPLS